MASSKFQRAVRTIRHRYREAQTEADRLCTELVRRRKDDVPSRIEAACATARADELQDVLALIQAPLPRPVQ